MPGHTGESRLEGNSIHRLRDDRGLGIAEVVVAAVILFMVLTAVLGLVAQTTMMGIESQGLNAVSSAVNDYIERARALPFNRVALPPDGFVSEETTTVAGYGVTITPTFDTPSNMQLKNLVLSVEVTPPGGTPRAQYVVRAIIMRDYDAQYAQQYPPSITFQTPTPPANTVVAGYTWDPYGANSLIQFALSANVNALDRTIEEVVLSCDGIVLEAHGTGDPGRWTVGEGIAFGSRSWSLPFFTWSSLQQDGLFMDGPHTFEAVVVDSRGAIGRAQTTLYLDNDAPVFKHLVSSGITFDYKDAEAYNQDNMIVGPEYLYGRQHEVPDIPIAKSVVRFKPQFELAWDGNVVAPYHRMQLLRAHPNTPGAWIEGPMHDVGLPLRYIWPVEETRGFGVFKARAWGYSGNPYQRLTLGYEESPVVYSTPVITGTYLTTYVDGSYSHEVTVTCDAPTFPVAGTTTYDWFWQTADYTATTHKPQHLGFVSTTSPTASFRIPPVTDPPEANPHNGWRVGCYVTFIPAGQSTKTAVAAPAVGWYAVTALPTPVGSGVLPIPK